MEASSIAVLIPAAGKSVAGSTEDSSALAVVGGRPVLEWSLEYLSKAGFCDFHIGVPCGESTLRQFVELRYGRILDITPHEINASSVGETIRELARETRARGVLIVLGDTYVEFPATTLLGGTDPVVWIQEASDASRWCAISHDSSDIVTDVSDKTKGTIGPVEAAVGAYFFPSREDLIVAIEEAAASERGGVEIADILRQFAAKGVLRAERSEAWFDAGHSDLKWSSTRQLLSSRSFNRLSVDERFGTVTKHSVNSEKLINEINYLRLLPRDLAMLFPRLGAYSVNADNVWVTQEFYAYPTLAEYFLYHTLDDSVWERVFLRLRSYVIDEFSRYKQPLAEGDVRDMYLGKLLNRTASLTTSETMIYLTSASTVRVNGREYQNIPSVLPQIERSVEVMSANVVGTVVHGDLCFANILFDVPSSICRLIDPRGSFGRVGIGGDPRYDVAKLWHSIAGGYDFLASDFYEIKIAGNAIELSIPWRPQHHRLREMFGSVFGSDFKLEEISVIAGLMMCSLPTLHSESPPRQAALYAMGLQLLNEGLD